MRMPTPKHILVIGGTGFIGRKLIPVLVGAGHAVSIYVRSKKDDLWLTSLGVKSVTDFSINMTNPYDIVINLAGESIGHPCWTQKRKNMFWTSRINTTQNITEAIQHWIVKPSLFISSSGISIYGDTSDCITIEDDGFDATKGLFLQRLCIEWEKAAFSLQEKKTRVAVLRIAPVLGKSGGVLKNWMKFFIGNTGFYHGKGHYWNSWIHETDLVRSIIFLIENAAACGVYNLSAPWPILQKELMQTLGTVLGKTNFFSIPDGLIRFFLGEMAKNLLLINHRVYPNRLLMAGFEFKYPTLLEALKSLTATH